MDECSKMYIEILERISDAFNRIPNCIKEKFPGYDKNTYSKMNHLKAKLKSIIQNNSKRNKHKKDYNTDETANNIDERQNTQSMSTFCDDEDFCANYKENSMDNKNENRDDSLMNNPSTSTPDILSFDKPQTSKTIYADALPKKLLSFNTFSPCNGSLKDSSIQSDTELDTSDSKKGKGKFVFKRPSRLTIDDSVNSNNSNDSIQVPSSTFDRVKTASEKLQPLRTEVQMKVTPLPSSSVHFQAPLLSKSSLLNEDDINRNSPNEEYEDMGKLKSYIYKTLVSQCL